MGAGEEMSVEVLGRLVGQQRREAEEGRAQLRSLAARVGDFDGSFRALAQRITGIDPTSRLTGLEKALERTHKSVTNLHIGQRLGSNQSTELPGRGRLLRHCVLQILRQAGDDPARTFVRVYGSRQQQQELAEGGVPIARGSEADLRWRASVDPAKITVPGWAAELVVTDVQDFLAAALRPSAFTQLSALGTQLEFANAAIPFPTIPASPSGGWVAEGGPIPASAGVLGLALLAPHKVAALGVFSNELRDLSLPSIEAVIEFLLSESLHRILDSSLLDANAATALRPAGLRNGVAGLTPSGLTDPAQAMVADIRALAAAIMTAGGTAPVVLMNPAQSISMATVLGTGLPSIIVSPGVPVAMLVAVDQPSFISALGAPRLAISKEAVVHQETVPLPLSATGSPNVVAAPVRSLWQTDASGLRMIFDCSWSLAGTGRSAWMAGVLW